MERHRSKHMLPQRLVTTPGRRRATCYGSCFAASRGRARENLVPTRERKRNAISTHTQLTMIRGPDSGTYFATKRLEVNQGLCDCG